MSDDPVVPDSSRAVLIGVPHYQDAAYHPYAAVGNSVDGMYDLLVDSGLCGWQEDQVTKVVDPTDAGRLIGHLRNLAARTTGVLLLYFVGHGAVSEQGELCLAITDTDHENPDTTGLEFAKIRRMLYSGTPAVTRIVILDCCFSGRAIGLSAADDGRQLADLSDCAGTYTLTAADGPAHVPPGDKAHSRSALTGELYDLLTRDGVPGAPEGLTLGAIFPRLRQRLAAKGLPEPGQRNDHSAADFVFARNTAHRSYSDCNRPQLQEGLQAPIISNAHLPRPSSTTETARIAGADDTQKMEPGSGTRRVPRPFIQLLGPVELLVDVGEARLRRSGERCVLAVLALNLDTPITLDALADRVWSQAQQTKSSLRTLRYYIRQIRSAIKRDSGDPDVLRHERRTNTYSLHLERGQVDYHQFHDLVTAAQQQSDPTLFRQALDAWPEHAQALADLPRNPWTDHHRELMQAQRRDAHLDLLKLQLNMGEYTEVTHALALTIDHITPTDRVLTLGATALARNGRRADIPAWVQRVIDRMRDTTGVVPSPTALQLAERLIADAWSAPPRKTLDWPAIRPEGKTSPTNRKLRENLRGEMLNAGRTHEQIALEIAARWGVRPRPAWRHAYGWTQEQVAERYNALTGDPPAAMTGHRISSYETWPLGGIKPTPSTLSILAKVYETHPAHLVDFHDLQLFTTQERVALELPPE